VSFITFGDSITNGYPVTSSQIWAKLVADYLGTNLVNYAISSSQASDQAYVAQGHTPTDQNIYGVMLGVNDVTVYGDNTVKRQAFKDHMRALVAWLSLPARTAGAAMAKAGSWSPFAPIGSYTFDVGGNGSGSSQGSSLYVGFRNQVSADSEGVSEIRVDGVLKATRQGNGVAVGPTTLGSSTSNPNYHGRTYGPQCVRIPNLGNGGHSVEVRNTLASKATLLESIAGSDQEQNPQIFLLNIPTRTGDPAWRTGYNQALSDLASEFVADGRNVVLVDIASEINSSDLFTDGLHINAAGHAKIAASVIKYLVPVTPFVPYQRSYRIGSRLTAAA
jgi:lysophospholipase L1-like esterase